MIAPGGIICSTDARSVGAESKVADADASAKSIHQPAQGRWGRGYAAFLSALPLPMQPRQRRPEPSPRRSRGKAAAFPQEPRQRRKNHGTGEIIDDDGRDGTFRTGARRRIISIAPAGAILVLLPAPHGFAVGLVLSPLPRLKSAVCKRPAGSRKFSTSFHHGRPKKD